MRKLNYCLICITFLMLTACAPTRYAWHGYDQNLYNHYKNPADHEEFAEKIKEVIEDGEADGKVPPGLYAEYGFVLYEKGDFPDAIIFFNKEQTKWPESKVLMAKMISNAQKKSAQGENKKDDSVKASSSTEVTQ